MKLSRCNNVELQELICHFKSCLNNIQICDKKEYLNIIDSLYNFSYIDVLDFFTNTNYNALYEIIYGSHTNSVINPKDKVIELETNKIRLKSFLGNEEVKKNEDESNENKDESNESKDESNESKDESKESKDELNKINNKTFVHLNEFITILTKFSNHDKDQGTDSNEFRSLNIKYIIDLVRNHCIHYTNVKIFIEEIKDSSKCKNQFLKNLNKILKNKQPVISYLKIRNDGHRLGEYNQRFKIETSGDSTEMKLSYYDYDFPFYSDTKIANDFITTKRDFSQTITFPNNIIPQTYYFGGYSKIFIPDNYTTTIENKVIAEEMVKVCEKLETGNPVYLLGYGASGAGKTSSLIYFKNAKNEQNKIGIAIRLLNNLGNEGKYNKIRIQYAERYYEKDDNNKKFNYKLNEFKDTENTNNEELKKITFDFDGNNWKLHSPYKHKNTHKYRFSEEEEEKKFTDESLGEVIIHIIDTDRLVYATTNNPNSSRSHKLVCIYLMNEELTSTPSVEYSTTTTTPTSETIPNTTPKSTPKNTCLIIGDLAGVENIFVDDEQTQIAFSNIKSDVNEDELHYNNSGKYTHEYFDYKNPYIPDTKNDFHTIPILDQDKRNSFDFNEKETFPDDVNFVKDFVVTEREVETSYTQLKNLNDFLKIQLNNIDNNVIKAHIRIITEAKKVKNKTEYDDKVGQLITKNSAIDIQIEKLNKEVINLENVRFNEIISENKKITYLDFKKEVNAHFLKDVTQINLLNTLLVNSRNIPKDIPKDIQDIWYYVRKPAVDEKNGDTIAYSGIKPDTIKAIKENGSSERIEKIYKKLKTKDGSNNWGSAMDFTSVKTALNNFIKKVNNIIDKEISEKNEKILILRNSKNKIPDEESIETINEDYVIKTYFGNNIIFNNLKTFYKKENTYSFLFNTIITKHGDTITRLYDDNLYFHNLVEFVIHINSENKYRDPYIKDVVNSRIAEGKYINSSLMRMTESIDTILRNKNKDALSPIPNFIDFCYDNYSFDDSLYYGNIKGGDTQTNNDEDIMGIVEKFLTGIPNKQPKMTLSDLTICVFCLLNISRGANDPPPIPYLDINNLKNLFYRFNDINNTDEKNKIIKEIDYIKSRIIKSEKNIDDLELYKNYSVKLKELDAKMGTITNYAQKNIYQLTGDLTETSSFNDFKKTIELFIDAINKSNAASAVGTLEFFDRFAKMNYSRAICKIDDVNDELKNNLKNYNFKYLYGQAGGGFRLKKLRSFPTRKKRRFYERKQTRRKFK